ncbi:MAG TPA: putative sugar O-methyltransferase [Pseudolabrys sp.]|nr:putative sugar O-methyltransferase [Pseudolabrys sp.]
MSRRRRIVAGFNAFLGRTKLASDQAALLALMRADNAKASAHYRPGPGRGWTALAREFDALFRTEGICDVERQGYNARFSSFPPGSRAYYLYAAHQLYNSLRDADRYCMFDRLRRTQGSTSGDHVVTFDGIALTWDVLLSVQNLIAVAEVMPQVLSEPAILLDLGAGWGRIGHVLLRVNPRATYIAADLPETLLIAESYLPRTIPSVLSYGYQDHRGGGRFSAPHWLLNPASISSALTCCGRSSRTPLMYS